MKKILFKNGYIALTSVMIISIVIMIIAITLSSYSFFSRSNVLDAEFKKIGGALAEACAEKALLKIAQNNSYAGNENIIINSGKQCSILTVENGAQAGQKIIKTTASFQNFSTNFKITVNVGSFGVSVISFEEVANF